MGPEDNFTRIKDGLPAGVTLVVVSKTRPVNDILRLYRMGHRAFGENKAQELISKQPNLPSDLQWHFIGHLQTNKVKYIASFIHLIESVDSLHLLSEIEKQAKKQGRIIDCLLQLYIATEESKFGLSLQEAEELLQSVEYKSMENIKIRGVMGMASFTDDREKIRQEFRSLKGSFQHLKKTHFPADENFSAISMGMSHDWEIALEEGATIVRIGTAIFGERTYSEAPE